jgi:hypothetical protein
MRESVTLFVSYHTLPDKEQSISLLKARLARSIAKNVSWKRLADIAAGLSYAEVSRASEDSLKNSLINKTKNISEAEIADMLAERKNITDRLQRQHR